MKSFSYSKIPKALWNTETNMSALCSKYKRFWLKKDSFETGKN